MIEGVCESFVIRVSVVFQREGMFVFFICVNCSGLSEYGRDSDVDNCFTACVFINDSGIFLMSCDSEASFKTGDFMAPSVVSISVVPINSDENGSIFFVLISTVVPDTVLEMLGVIGSVVILAPNILSELEKIYVRQLSESMS